MPITIQELQVEVTGVPAPTPAAAATAPTAAPAAGRPAKIDLRAALLEVGERQKRLQAD